MKILHVVTLVSPDGAFGGPLRVALNQAGELSARGHEVHLAAGWRGGGKAPTSVEGVPALLFGVSPLVRDGGFSGLVSPGLTRWLFTHVNEYDVVHVHSGRDLMSLTAMTVARLRKSPYVAQTHGMVGPDRRLRARVLDRLLTRRLLRAAATRFVLTDQEATDLGAVLGPVPVRLLANGVRLPTERWLGPPAAPGALASPEVLFCARLHSRKRPLAFVALAAELIGAGVDATFRLVGPDEGELDAVRRTIDELGLAGRVAYEGALAYSEVLGRMRRAAVYVLPSVDEPFPMTLLEALSLGLPCVCTDSSGVAETLRARGAALVTDRSVPALAGAVAALLRDSELRSRTSAEARRAAEEVYAISAVASLLEGVYTEIAVRGRAPIFASPGG